MFKLSWMSLRPVLLHFIFVYFNTEHKIVIFLTHKNHSYARQLLWLCIIWILCISKTLFEQAYCGVVAGLAVATLSTIFMPVSGAHLNPAVSLSAAVIHRITPLRGVSYVVAQCGGAIAGKVVTGMFGFGIIGIDRCASKSSY